MDDRFSRIKILIGQANMDKLKNSTVVVLGLGGVGGSATETLARSGVGNLTIVDNDVVTITNINRQIIATEETIGKRKTDVMEVRIKSINPNCNVKVIDAFISKENVGDIVDGADFVLDCIDTITAKLDVIEYCSKKNIKIISSMGAGNKLHPELLEFSDIKNTSMCPLAKVMRRELKNREVDKLMVVYSKEKPIDPEDEVISEDGVKSEMKAKRKTPGSTAFVPPVSGIMMASHVINSIIENNN